MNCQESQEQISALYDGEPVPPAFAHHVDNCPDCRESLRAYSEIGAELRLLASRQKTSLIPPFHPPARLNRGFSLTGKMRVSKLAVAAAAALFLVMSAGLFRVVHAQQNQPPLWFRLNLSLKIPGHDSSGSTEFLAPAGYDEVSLIKYDANSVTAIRVNVSRIYPDHIELAVRARLYNSSDLDSAVADSDLHDLTGRSLTYRPGDPLTVPIENGGTLVLAGDILDHKPKFLAGIPLDPAPDQLILAKPIFISGNNVLYTTPAMAWNRGPECAVGLYAPGTGFIKIAFESTAGAVQASANLTNLEFTLNGKSYTLRTISPITGGDQPRTLWVTNDPNFVPSDPRLKSGFVMAGSLKSVP